MRERVDKQMSYATEPELLLDYLNEQRHHVVGTLEGLSDDQLRRPVLPSGWRGQPPSRLQCGIAAQPVPGPRNCEP